MPLRDTDRCKCDSRGALPLPPLGVSGLGTGRWRVTPLAWPNDVRLAATHFELKPIYFGSLNIRPEGLMQRQNLHCFFPKATAKGSLEKSTTIKDCRSDGCLERLSSKTAEVITVFKDCHQRLPK